ncbi:hypothetical protein ACFWN2_07395 [Lentzea sp. NPDC058436]|uniref:hypothetical protein n=1 Tax=Lentzea sp. NPDC058436 TaxID=3346499 RepID=UPI003667DED4
MLDEREVRARALSSRLRAITMRLASAGAAGLAAEARNLLCEKEVASCVELVTHCAAAGVIGLTAEEVEGLGALTGDPVVTARLVRLRPVTDQSTAVPVLPPSRVSTAPKHVLLDRAAVDACTEVRDAVSLRVAWRAGRTPVRVHLVEFARYVTDHDVLVATRALDEALDVWHVPNRSVESYRPTDVLPRGYRELVARGDEIWRRRS